MRRIIRFDMDVRAFEVRAQRLERNRAQARTNAVKAQADVFVGYIAAHGPRDTNRFVRSYAQAGNMAGLRRRPLPALRRSKYSKYVGRALRGAVELGVRNVEIWAKRVERWARQEDLYRSTGRRHHKYFQKILNQKRLAEKELRFHTRRLEAATRELEQYQAAENAGGFSGVAIATWGLASGGRISYRSLMRAGTQSAYVVRRGVIALRKNPQIETKVYGGTGKTIAVGDTSFVSLTSREPHARFVNRNTSIVTRALAHARSRTGARRFTKLAYTRALAAGTGMDRQAA